MSGYVFEDGGCWFCVAHRGGERMNEPYACAKCAKPLAVGALFDFKLSEKTGTWHFCLDCYNDIVGELEDLFQEIMKPTPAEPKPVESNDLGYVPWVE